MMSNEKSCNNVGFLESLYLATSKFRGRLQLRLQERQSNRRYSSGVATRLVTMRWDQHTICICLTSRFKNQRRLKVTRWLDEDALFSVFTSCFLTILGSQHRKLLFILEWWAGLLCSDPSFLSRCFWLHLPESKGEGEKLHAGLSNCRVRIV